VSITNQAASQQLPTQVEYPRRASWRTFVQALIAFVPTANGVLLAIQELLREEPFHAAVPGWVYAATNAAVLLGAFLAKVVTQLMGNPVVNDWLERSAPKLAARDTKVPPRA